jgi:NADH-quinone oxidoreductase subunit E
MSEERSAAGSVCDLSPLDNLLDRYSGDSGSLITILQKTQDIYGYLPMAAIYRVAERTGSTPAKVLGVATFYAQFRLQPSGKYLILMCQGTACHVNSSERVRDAVKDALGIGEGETTADGLFTLRSVACLGCCSLSTVMMINDEAYGALTPDKAVSIIAGIRSAEQEAKA